MRFGFHYSLPSRGCQRSRTVSHTPYLKKTKNNLKLNEQNESFSPLQGPLRVCVRVTFSRVFDIDCLLYTV